MRKLTFKLLLVSLMLMPVFLTFGQSETILSEDFSDGIMPPTGWSIDPTANEGAFFISNDTHAGGVAPQGGIDGTPQFIGSVRLISPVIDVSSYTTLELDLRWAVNSANYGNFSFKAETTSDGGVTWNEVWSVTPTGYTPGTPVNIPITNGDFGSATFQFCYTYAPTALSANWWAYFDDLVLSGEAPVTCFPPTDLAAANITTSGADLSWTPAGSEPQWNLEWGTTGFTPGAGTMVNDLASPTHSLSGLDQGISYDFYVQANCGGGDLSAFAGPYTFTTSCAAMVAPAWSEGFENGGALPACWSLNGSEDWLFDTSAGHVGFEGNISGNTVTGSYFAYVDDSTPDNVGTTLESPWIDVSALTAPMIEFYLISDNEGHSNVDFHVFVFDGAGWNPMLTSNSNTINGGWEYKYILLDGLTITGDIKIRFVVDELVADDIYDDVAIDDVSVVETPTCPSPINPITNSIAPLSADLNWTAGTTEMNWDIEWGLSGFTPGTGTLVNDHNSTSLSLSGLSPVTFYDWYLRADCGGDDINVSSWVGPITFQTIADPVSGNYTINSAAPTGGTNFNNFTDFAYTMNLGGLSGPLTVDVVAASGPYNEQLILGEINNSSATNTVTLNGNGEKLEYLSTNADQRAVVKLDGTDYFTIDNLIVKVLGSVSGEYGTSIQLMNESDYNTFTNCEFISDPIYVSTSFYNFVVGHVNNLMVQNCKILGGHTGMVITGSTTAPYAQNNTITGNEITDFHTYGLNLKYQNNSVFSDNEISRPTRPVLGSTWMIRLTGNFSGSEFTKNRIFEFGNVTNTAIVYGMYGTDIAANLGEELLIANNVISGFQNMNDHLYGIRFTTIDGLGNLKVYHNTVSLDNADHPGSNKRFYPFYHTGANAILDVRNNIFSYIPVDGSGNKFCTFFGTTTATVTSDNNVLDRGTTGGQRFTGKWGSANFLTLANWQTANGGIFDLNSSDADPEFIDPSVGDLTPTNYLIDNIGADLLTVVPDDINGVLRTITPDPGAYEFDPPTCIKPSQLSVGSVTTTSAFLEWVDNNITPATMWDIEVVEAGVLPTGTPTVAGVTTNPYEYTGLNPSTTYDWYVRTNCGGGDFSFWSGPGTFLTLCGPRVVYPYLEDFEIFTPALNATGYTNCWTTSPEGTTTAYRWNVDVGGTASGSTGPIVDHTTGTAAGIYLYVESSQGATGDTAYLYSPEYDLTAFPTAHLGFWYHMYGSQIGELHIDITTDGGLTWVEDIMTPIIGQQQASNADPYLNLAVSLFSYVDETVQFRFRSIKGGGYRGDMAIDDVSIYSGYSISGNLTYANTAMTVLDTATVELYDNLDVLVRTTTSDATGYYEFPGVMDGDYTRTVVPDYAWGGCDIFDVNFAVYYMLGGAITDLEKIAGDVDLSDDVDIFDVNYMVAYILGDLPAPPDANSWPAAPYVFENTTVNVSGGDVTDADISTRCSGDMDASHTPE